MKKLIAFLILAFSTQTFASATLCPSESKTVFVCTPNPNQGDDETLKKLFRDLSVCRDTEWVTVALQRLDGTVDFEKIKTIMTIGDAVTYTNGAVTLAVAQANGDFSRAAKLVYAQMSAAYSCSGKPD